MRVKRNYCISFLWKKTEPRFFRIWRWPDAYMSENDEFSSEESMKEVSVPAGEV